MVQEQSFIRLSVGTFMACSPLYAHNQHSKTL
jgi:hypothetical protein